jgi:hypothetical protein
MKALQLSSWSAFIQALQCRGYEIGLRQTLFWNVEPIIGNSVRRQKS